MNAAFLLTAIFMMCLPASAQPKLIHYGWDNPDITSLPVVLPKLKDSVFDGLAANSKGHDQIFSAVPFHPHSFARDNAVLKILPSRALANSYLLLHAATDDKFDWSNKKHWASSLSNMRQMAKLAKAGGFKGLVFDMEPYGKSPWNYHSQKAKDQLSFAAFQDLLQSRGAEMMEAMQQEFPGLDLWCLFGLSAHSYLLADPVTLTDANALLINDGYGLWSAFFGGMVASAADDTRIIDGNEPSYYYTDAAGFAKAATTIKADLQRFLKPKLRKTYEQKILLGHAVYVDGVMNLHNSPRFIGYYFKSDKDRLELLARNTANALATSETLVWVYAEKNRWWDGVIRKDVDAALQRAKNAVAKTAAIPASVALRAAEKQLKTRVTIGGKFQTSNGKGVKPESFGSPFNDMACSTWGDEGDYACEFPKDSNVVITPRTTGAIFEPGQQHFKAVAKSTYGIDWVVK